ncbi:tyrosine-type recombinase/integrase, partial [Clostridium perfringens]
RRYLINQYIKNCLKTYTEGLNFENKDFIFKSRKGNNHIERTQAYRILNKACIEANVKINIGTHTLRKTFGYHFYKQYRDLKYLQKLFNHPSTKITKKYIEIEEDVEYKSFSL